MKSLNVNKLLAIADLFAKISNEYETVDRSKIELPLLVDKDMRQR